MRASGGGLAVEVGGYKLDGAGELRVAAGVCSTESCGVMSLVMSIMQDQCRDNVAGRDPCSRRGNTSKVPGGWLLAAKKEPSAVFCFFLSFFSISFFSFCVFRPKN